MPVPSPFAAWPYGFVRGGHNSSLQPVRSQRETVLSCIAESREGNTISLMYLLWIEMFFTLLVLTKKNRTDILYLHRFVEFSNCCATQLHIRLCKIADSLCDSYVHIQYYGEFDPGSG